MDIIRRIKKFFIRLLVLVRKKLREIEAKLDKMQPHPVFGGVAIVAGFVVCVAGLFMMVLPGPGVLALALGIAFIVVGIKIAGGKYGPDRLNRERKEKKERLLKRRKARKAQQERERMQQEQIQPQVQQQQMHQQQVQQ